MEGMSGTKRLYYRNHKREVQPNHILWYSRPRSELPLPPSSSSRPLRGVIKTGTAGARALADPIFSFPLLQGGVNQW